MDATNQYGPSVNEVVSSDATTRNPLDNVARVKKLINRRMLVGIKDGRFFLGTFLLYRQAREPYSSRCSGVSQHQTVFSFTNGAQGHRSHSNPVLMSNFLSCGL